LAGARIGYAIGEAALIANFEKVRNHYGINRTGQTGALAAIQDQAYLAAAVERITRARERISAIAQGNGLMALPSATNFVAIDCGQDGAFAKAVLQALLERDVFARKPIAPGLDRCIRVSCGLDAELDVFAEILPLALTAARSSK
jgi:histidinol-phosphate aminotransferase